MEYTDIELKNEKWKDIEGYDGMYQVSSLGRVRSKKYGRWKVLRPQKNRDGYLSVNLSKNSNQKRHSVHRLVAKAFIDNDNTLNDQVNHRNEDKTDNRVTNLEWCDRSYNITYNGLQQRRTANYHRSNYKRDEIKNLYRPDLSIDDNIKLFKSNGIKCCRETVKRLRKDLGLTKHYRPIKPKQVVDVIN